MQRSVRSLLLKPISSYPFPRSTRPISPFLEPSNPSFSYPYQFKILFLSTLPTSSCPSPVQFSPNLPTQIGNRLGGRRSFAAGELVDHSKEVDEINLKFAEAREEIEAAMESKETVYFDEEAECAREAVKEVLDKYEGLLARLSEKDRTALQRSMGLKIEQLKAELKQLDD